MSSRLEAFTGWLTAFGDAWEAGDSGFADVVRGRRGVVAWFADVFAAWPGASFTAQVLGAGDTYGVAHWRVASADRALDGVWVVALDARGRCESLREWSSKTPE